MAPPLSPDALAKLQVTTAQETEWKRLKTDWVNSKKAATKELNKHIVTMKFPGYNKDTAGLETQQQVLDQLVEAINVLNTCKKCLVANTGMGRPVQASNAPQPEPTPIPAAVAAESTAPDNKNYKSRPELKPNTLTVDFSPLELNRFIAQATN